MVRTFVIDVRTSNADAVTRHNLSDQHVLQAPDSCCAPFDRVLLESFIKGVVESNRYEDRSGNGGANRRGRWGEGGDGGRGGDDNGVRNISSSSSSSVVAKSSAALNQASFHLYANPSSCSPTALIDPGHAEVTAEQMRAYHNSIVSAGHKGQVVLSETAGHSVGGTFVC